MELGLDVGFGDVKGVFKKPGRNSLSYFKFPTAITHAVQGVAAIEENSDTATEFVFKERKYFVGEEAVAGAYATRDIGFLKEFIPLLVYKAIYDKCPGAKILSVGLPLAYYGEKNKTEIAQKLLRISVNGSFHEFEEIQVRPQGMGILFDFRMDNAGGTVSDTKLNGLVIDVGFNTVDVVAFEKGVAVKRDSEMLEKSGVSKAVREMQQEIQSKGTFTLSEQEAKEAWVAGHYMSYGRKMDITEKREAAAREYVEWLIREIRSRWDERLRRADKLILAGGGAYYLQEYMPTKYKSLIHVPDRPEFANARGFWKAILNSEK